jgi:hypothetical protein
VSGSGASVVGASVVDSSLGGRRRLGPIRAAAIVANLAFAALAWPVQPALAVMTDNETVASTFSTETLDPPTALTATAALLLRVNLSWTATVDLRATGYEVFRGTASGGPYTQITTITSRTTTTYQDTVPLPSQYYYVLKTYFGSWTSVNSNQASVIAA